MPVHDAVLEAVGESSFRWLSGEFNEQTTMRDIPDEILDALACTNMATRDYAADRNAIIAIAMITFAYRMAGKVQLASQGPKDILLLKVLAKEERARRRGTGGFKKAPREIPVFEIVTGEVGDSIRAMRTLNSPA